MDIASADLRKALATHILQASPQSGALAVFLQTPDPSPEIIAMADWAIADYLNRKTQPVFGRGARFFLPISAEFGTPGIGEPLVYSDGERTGLPIKKDGVQTGVRFRNAVDGIEQGVRGDGKSVIIIGGALTPEKAGLLQQRFFSLTGGTGDPEVLDLVGIKSFLDYAATELELNDIWTGSVSGVLKAAPVDGRAITPEGPLKQYAGYFVHRPEPNKGVAAIHVRGGARFHGDVAGGLQDYSQAPGFFVTIGMREGVSQYRGVAEEAFCRDYVTEAEDSCHPAMLFSLDAATREVARPAVARIGSGTKHPAIAAPSDGGRTS